MTAATIAAFALAAGVVVLALRLVVTEREAFRLERIGRLERHHTQMSGLIAEHAAAISDLLRQQHDERTILLEEHRSDIRELRSDHRADVRELLTRAMHPQLLPQAVRTAAPPSQNASERARAAWTGIGRAAPPAPAAPTDEVGGDVP